MNSLDQLDLLAGAMREVNQSIDALEKEINDLEAAGISKAGTWWKGGKYLYLVHPTDDKGNRHREYIGSDQAAIDDALARIKRYGQWIELRHQLNELRSSERSARLSIDHAMFYLKSIQRKLWGNDDSTKE